jgi:hypothetical protein
VSDPVHLTLSPRARRAFERMAADFARVLGNRFVALAAHSARDALAVAHRIDPADLDALAALCEAWHRDGLYTPLVITRDELHRSLDAFPLEYQAILDRHVLVAGTNPFNGAEVRPADLRRACEVQAKAHLIHLRQGWLEAAGHEEELAALVARSAPPLRILLTQLCHLSGAPARDDADLAGLAEQQAGLPPALGLAILALEDNPDGASALVPELPRYLAAAERLWAVADSWRQA